MLKSPKNYLVLCRRPSIIFEPLDMDNEPNLFQWIKTFVMGKARNPQDPEVFHKLALIAFFAWIGLGADGLSSSCYGPAEAFAVLKDHHYLGIFVALGSALTIFVISASYSQIIELFPTGGGGYLVASKLLSPTLGMIAGCALLIDYVLTIALSIASGAEAIFSSLPSEWFSFRFEFAIIGVLGLTILNLRGVKESVITLMPIFLVFVATHIFVIIYAVVAHADSLPLVAENTAADIHSVTSEVGILGLILLLFRAYSMGAGTYTGIEAVSNSLPILREPKVLTGKRTMGYIAVSLAVTVTGLMLAYILYGVNHIPGKTLNAILYESITAGWGHNLAYTFVLIILLSEVAILFVAAQAGILAGPRVLANMALDRWFPIRFAYLNDRLVTQNGILLMGGAALALIILTGGSVQILIVLYSINVFITFVLSQSGMVRHWWNVRAADPVWKRRIIINGIGLVMTVTILISISAVKFFEGGWVTFIITGCVVLFVVVIKRHYKKTFGLLGRLDQLMVAADMGKSGSIPKVGDDSKRKIEYDRNGATAVLLVNGYNGLGLHAVLDTFKLFRGVFKNFIFVQVGVVDAGVFKGTAEINNLRAHIQGELDKYVKFLNSHGYYAEGVTLIGTNVVEEIDRIAPEILERFPRVVFFGGQIVFLKETIFTRWLHNYVVFAVQKKLYLRGVPFVILPIII